MKLLAYLDNNFHQTCGSYIQWSICNKWSDTKYDGSSWWLQMAWCQIGTRTSATTIMTDMINVPVNISQSIYKAFQPLTHLPLVPYIYASVNQVSIGSDNGLSPIWRQAIISINVGLLSIGVPSGTNFSEILIKIQNFSITKIHMKILSEKWWPFCPGGDELTHWVLVMQYGVMQLC